MRVRQVYDNDMIAHLWAAQSQAAARNARGSFFFDSDTIYSYGRHFVIARLVTNNRGERAVLYNPNRYSQTTAGHQCRVRRACCHLPMFVVPHLNDSWKSGHISHADNLKYLRDELDKALAKVTTARKNKAYAIRAAEECAATGNAYVEFFDLKTRFTLPNLDDERARAAEYDRREAERRLERERQAELGRQEEREKAKETVEKWRAGEDVRFPGWLFDEVYLRVKGNVVETSKGASVPLAHAVRLLPHIRSGTAFHPNGRTIRVGHFQVDGIDEAGNLTAGCHKIARTEMERIAAQLGLQQKEVAHEHQETA